MQKVSDLYVPDVSDTRLERNSRNGNWEIRWTQPCPNGGKGRTKSFSCRTKDRKLAEQIRRQFCDAGEREKKHLETYTVGEVIAAYRTGYMQPNNISDTTDHTLRAVEKLLANTPLDLLDFRALQDYRKRRKASGVADGTVRREMSQLGTVLRWAEKTGQLPKGTAPEQMPLPPVGPSRDYWLNEQQEAFVFNKALAQLDEHGRLSRLARFVCIALCTAARSESIERLTWDRVDLKAKMIDFREKGRRVTKKRRVLIPISDRLFPILERAYNERTQDVFVLDHGGSTRKTFDTFRKNIGYRDLTRHDLRRTWATLAARAGVDMFQIAGVLGDTMETVMKHYAVHSPDHLRGAVNARR